MILIIAAMQEEMNALVILGEEQQEKTIYDIKVVEMKLAGKNVAVALSGVGKINAAFTATVLNQHYNTTLVINIGSAGGLIENQNIGDIVLAQKVQSHDLDIGIETPTDPRFIYYPNEEYAKLSERVAKDLGFSTHSGLIVSGDQFVVNGSYSHQRIGSVFTEAICAEMEAAAVGGVCSRMNIPFIVIRSLSDVPFRKDNDMDFETYLPIASKNSAKICYEFIDRITL